MSKGFRVTVEDLDRGESQSMVVGEGDYMLIPFHPCYLDGVQRHKNGTVQITVEVLEAVDHPSRELEGTVRQHDDGSIVVRTGRDRWIAPSNEIDFDHDTMANGEWRVIGAVPGTPAAEAEKRERSTLAAELRAKIRREEAKLNACKVDESAARGKYPEQRERRVFRSDGPEPPTGVDVLEDEGPDWGDMRYLLRTGDLWCWSPSRELVWPDHSDPVLWERAARQAAGSLREVV